MGTVYKTERWYPGRGSLSLEEGRKKGGKGGTNVLARLGAIWGIGGIVVALVFSVFRLAGASLEAFQYSWDWRHWTVLVLNTAFMAHSEGYKGFQKSLAPRVVARARVLLDNPPLFRLLLAPLFCMGYFHTTRRRLISVYVLTIGIGALIAAFQYISQPWRGLLDCGVVVGLSWGIVSIGVVTVKAWVEPDTTQEADLPDSQVPTAAA